MEGGLVDASGGKEIARFFFYYIFIYSLLEVLIQTRELEFNYRMIIVSRYSGTFYARKTTSEEYKAGHKKQSDMETGKRRND